MTIQEQLNQERIRKGKSIYLVSKQTGIAAHAINLVMSGGNCTVKTLVKIAEVLGMEVTLKSK